jgi:hypothetical protein
VWVRIPQVSFSVIADSSACEASMYVLPRCRTLPSCTQEEIMFHCLQHAPRTPASHSQRHAGDANRTWRSGQGRMDFHLCRLPVNVQVVFLVPSCSVTCCRGRSGSHCISPPSSFGRAQGPQPCDRGFEPHGGCLTDLDCISLFALHALWHVPES